MKSRIQLAGVAHGSHEKTLWQGDLPAFGSAPWTRIVLEAPTKDEATAFQVKQLCLEINTETGDLEQVVYVAHVDKTKQNEILG